MDHRVPNGIRQPHRYCLIITRPTTTRPGKTFFPSSRCISLCNRHYLDPERQQEQTPGSRISLTDPEWCRKKLRHLLRFHLLCLLDGLSLGPSSFLIHYLPSWAPILVIQYLDDSLSIISMTCTITLGSSIRLAASDWLIPTTSTRSISGTPSTSTYSCGTMYLL